MRAVPREKRPVIQVIELPKPAKANSPTLPLTITPKNGRARLGTKLLTGYKKDELLAHLLSHGVPVSSMMTVKQIVDFTHEFLTKKQNLRPPPSKSLHQLRRAAIIAHVKENVHKMDPIQLLGKLHRKTILREEGQIYPGGRKVKFSTRYDVIGRSSPKNKVKRNKKVN
jgi:hypothetical protein